jgi:hypothetical protein
MPGLDVAEILLVVVLVLLVVGPEGFPEWARRLGRGYGEIRRRLDRQRGLWVEPRPWEPRPWEPRPLRPRPLRPRPGEPRPPGRVEAWFNAGFDRLAVWFNALYDRLGL